MSTIERLTDAVVERLKLQVPAMKAEHFPDAPERFVWSKADKSLLVTYEGATYSPEPQSFDPLSLERTMDLGVTVITRGLRGKLGMASAIEDVRAALFGWEPTERVDGADVPMGWSRLMPTAERFVGEDQGSWRFIISFRTTMPVVAPGTERVRVPFTGLSFLEGECDQSDE